MVYKNREEAGRILAKKLRRFKNDSVVVLALPRGGVVLGAEVAKDLKAPLEPLIARKIGHPYFPEYAIGSVTEGQEPTFNEAEVARLDKQLIKELVATQRLEIERRKKLYFGDSRKSPDLKDKTAIIVDDGIATGYTMAAAISALAAQGPKRIVVAVPVAPAEAVRSLSLTADEVVVLDDPENFRGAVGAHYLDFRQIDDGQVKKILTEVNYDLYGKTPKNKQPAVVSQKDQEFSNHWIRYRPVR